MLIKRDCLGRVGLELLDFSLHQDALEELFLLFDGLVGDCNAAPAGIEAMLSEGTGPLAQHREQSLRPILLLLSHGMVEKAVLQVRSQRVELKLVPWLTQTDCLRFRCLFTLIIVVCCQ